MDFGYGGGGGDFSTTSYGAKGGAGGGGFMAGSSQNEGGDKAGKETLRPVTIKQMIDAEQPHPDSSFQISGAPAVQITFVGQIRNISEQATHYTYKLDDGTGAIEVKRWIDPQEVTAMEEDGVGSGRPQIHENAYVRIYGTLKTFGNKKHVVVRPAGVRPISNMNEVQMHMLEATAVHLYFERGPPGQQNGAGVHGQANGGDTYMNGTGDTGRYPPNISKNGRRVLDYIRSVPQTNEGLNVDEISVGVNLDVGDVQIACGELGDEGMVYSTIDENTWALADN